MRGKCLTLRMGPEIGLEAEGVDGGDEGFDGVEGRAGDRLVGHDVAPPAREHCVHLSLIHI